MYSLSTVARSSPADPRDLFSVVFVAFLDFPKLALRRKELLYFGVDLERGVLRGDLDRYSDIHLPIKTATESTAISICGL